jgi:hypothetical protein
MRRMKRASGLIVVVFALHVLPSCVTDSTGGADQVPSKGIAEPGGLPGLTLDEGRRWKVNAPMLEPIQRMQQRIQLAEEVPGDLDHGALADSLFVDIDQLITTCNMKGKAHDALHAWLMPHMQLVQDLERAAGPAEADSLLRALDRSARDSDRYFE